MFEDIIDMEIFYNPIFWFLTIGTEIALLIGFRSATLWGNGGLPLLTQVVILLAVPVVAYFVVAFTRR